MEQVGVPESCPRLRQRVLIAAVAVAAAAALIVIFAESALMFATAGSATAASSSVGTSWSGRRKPRTRREQIINGQRCYSTVHAAWRCRTRQARSAFARARTAKQLIDIHA